METTINKSKEVKTTLKLLNQKLHFEGNVEGNQPISIDYIPPFGDNLGYTSLELFLLSFSSCLGSALLIPLRKMQKSISVLTINSLGIRKEEHPTGFKTITVEVILKSNNTSLEEFDKVLKISESICPVWSMIKGNVEVIVKPNIIAE